MDPIVSIWDDLSCQLSTVARVTMGPWALHRYHRWETALFRKCKDRGMERHWDNLPSNEAIRAINDELVDSAQKNTDNQ